MIMSNYFTNDFPYQWAANFATDRIISERIICSIICKGGSKRKKLSNFDDVKHLDKCIFLFCSGFCYIALIQNQCTGFHYYQTELQAFWRPENC